MNMPPCRKRSLTDHKGGKRLYGPVGGANEASGATKTLSGVLNGVAGNIDNVATAAGRWLPSGWPGTLAIWPQAWERPPQS